jgi:DNA-binding MarR family transcriptional regulator
VSSGIDLTATMACRCLAARRAARALTRLYDEKLRPHGLRSTQFSVLAALALKGATPMGELAELLGLERTTLTRSAALLERNGWVRVATAEDARERPLRLTPAGRRKLEKAYHAWREAQDQIDPRSARPRPAKR